MEQVKKITLVFLSVLAAGAALLVCMLAFAFWQLELGQPGVASEGDNKLERSRIREILESDSYVKRAFWRALMTGAKMVWDTGQALDSGSEIFANMTSGKIDASKNLKINSPKNELTKLFLLAEQARSINHIDDASKIWVKGDAEKSDGMQSRIRYRLQGNNVDHVLTDKPSLYVKMLDGHFLGLNKFNLHHPWVRGGPDEWFVHKLLQRHGLPVVSYEPVLITWNGNKNQIMDYEGRWSSGLVAKNRLRNGNLYKIVFWIDDHDRIQLGLNTVDDRNDKSQIVMARLFVVLKEWVVGNIASSSIFNVDLLGRYIAVMDLTGARHGALPDNIVWHWDPVSARLTPLGREFQAWHNHDKLLGENDDCIPLLKEFYGILFRDPALRSSYSRTIREMNAAGYEKDVLSEFAADAKRVMGIWHSEYFHYRLPLEEFSSRVRDFKKEVSGADWYAGAPLTLQSPLQEPVFANANSGLEQVSYDVDLTGAYVVRPGRYRLDKPLIVTQGRALILEPGVQIELGAKALLFTRVPLHIRGNARLPVKIKGLPGNGGVHVYGAAVSSVFSAVQFEGLEIPSSLLWHPTGGITLHNSDLVATGMSVINSGSEDALNVVYGHAWLTDSHFSQAKSDAIDVDYGQLSIRNLVFDGAGNDAIDSAGSQLSVHNVSISNIGDKGISIGEKTEAQITAVTIKNCFIGIAVKDSSEAKLSDLSITECKQGLALYRKEKRYDGGRARVSKVRFAAVDVTAPVEARSELTWLKP